MTSATDSPARKRNRRGEGGKLREEIIDAATAILDEEGDQNAVSLRSVARRIGIAAPSIYPHFPDQPSIMLAVVSREMDALAAHLREAADAAGTDPRTRLLALAHAYLDLAQAHPSRYRIMFGGVWKATLTDTITEADLDTLGADALALMAETLAACVAAGQSTSDDPSADTIALWLGLHGLAHQRAVVRTFPWPGDIEDRLIRGLAQLA